jgi:hypothetical protein
MNSPTSSTKSLSDVKQLTYFRIHKANSNQEHGTIKLFCNGNQQCPITVEVIAAGADEVPITLTNDELRKAITLIEYNSGAPLADGYTASHTKNKFKWVENDIPALGGRDDESGHDASPLAAQPCEFFVSASPGSPGLQIAARFAVSDTLFFTTSPTSTASDGQSRDGEFDSSVEVLPAESPYLSATDYGAASNGVLLGRKVGDSSTYRYWGTEYYLNPKLNQKALPLHSVGSAVIVDAETGVTATGDFGFYAHGGIFDPVQWGVSYFARPTSTSPTPEPRGLPLAPLYNVVLARAPSSVGQGGGETAVTTSIRASGPVGTITTTVHFAGTDGPASKTSLSQDESNVVAMWRESAKSIVGAAPNRVVIGILKGLSTASFEDIDGASIADVVSTRLHILDYYGNDHALTLSYDAGADELTIV